MTCMIFGDGFEAKAQSTESKIYLRALPLDSLSFASYSNHIKLLAMTRLNFRSENEILLRASLKGFSPKYAPSPQNGFLFLN